MPSSYRGSAWNARFLYAPKIALELDQRPDFVSLKSLATVKLGVKTGCDDFFFLKTAEGQPRSSTYRHVGGFRGWIGDLSKADLLSAVRNPRDLTRDGVRLFRVPRRTNHFYLYPIGSTFKADLQLYVQAAEDASINQKRLVLQNSGDNSEWYVQSRGIVRPDWVLPYNSAYDYGAFENEGRAVINGRFIGLIVAEDVDKKLLGAALNSTFTIIARLIEGVPTGSEGALDLGPPAARLMKVPDVRAMQGAGVEQVRVVMEDLRRVNVMPGAPSRDGHVPELRRRLDDAVMYALGVAAGERAILLDRVYASYGRWRTAVENVEMRMRANRRTTARLGLSRSESLIARASRRVWDELSGDYPALPSDLLEDTDRFDIVDIAPSFHGIGQDALFGEGLTPDGRGGTVDLGSIERLEYGMLLRDLGYGRVLDIVREDSRASDIVRRARDEIIRFLEEAATRARQYASDSDVSAAVDGAVRLWYEHSRGKYRIWMEDYQGKGDAASTLK